MHAFATRRSRDWQCYTVMLNAKNEEIMSAAQAMASQRFLDAMGPMIYEEQKMKQVLLFINSMQSNATISQAKFDSMRTIDDLDAHLEARIRNRSQRVEA